MKKDQAFPIEMGKRIRAARKEKGYTIERLAEITDMAPQYISEVERGKKSLGSENLKAVCLALGKSADFFLFGIGDVEARRANLLEGLVALPPVDRELAIRLLENLLTLVRRTGENQ